MAVRYIPPSKNVGDSVHDINYNFDYLDTHIEDVLQAAEDYADGRDAEFLAVSADYAEEKALQAQQAAQAYADSLVYTHPAYTARDVNKVSGTQQITPGTPFTLSWFSVDNTGHVYQSGSSYFNIEPYVHPTYAEKDIGRETGIKQLNPGTTFTLPWVHVDNKGHVSQSGSSTYNISHDADKVDTSDFETYQETINTSISEIGADIDDINSDISTLSTGKANKIHSHSEYLEKTASEFTGNSATATTAANLSCRDRFHTGNGTSTAYQYYKLGKVSLKQNWRVLITLVGEQGWNGRNTGGIKFVTLSGNYNVNGTTGLFVGGALYDFGNSDAVKILNTSEFNILLVRAEGYTNMQADVYIKYSAAVNYTSYLVLVDTPNTDAWTRSTSMTNTDPTASAVAAYEVPCKVIRDDYLLPTDNAATATKLATARTINGVSFDGSANITIPLKNSASGTLLADTSANANSVAITNAKIAKYSQIYMSASWTERETVDFCDVIPVADIIAGAVFTRTTNTGTRSYTYTVTCTSAGLFTLTQSNSTGTAGTLRLKLYVI